MCGNERIMSVDEMNNLLLLEQLLEDSVDVHHGYTIPRHLYYIAYQILALPQSKVEELFKKYDYSKDKQNAA